MDDGDSSGEARGEALNSLGREGDLGDEDDRVVVEVESPRNRAEINFGLATPGHAVQEEGWMWNRGLGGESKGGVYGLPRSLLIDGERGRFGRHKNLPGQRVADDLFAA